MSPAEDGGRRPAEKGPQRPRPGVRRSATSLATLRRAHPSLRVIAPARTKDALIAAIYLAVDAPEYAALNYDALADVLGDLAWLPAGPVHLAWVSDAALPTGVQRTVMQILADAAAESADGRHPLWVYQLVPPR